MRINSSKIILIILMLIYFLPLILEYIDTSEINLNPNDYARITDVDYKAELVDEPNSNGKVIVTERITYDIHAASKNNPFWELWRDLPESYEDGIKVEYKVNSVKQILDNENEVIYQESPKLYWEDDDYVNTDMRLWTWKMVS